MRTETPSIPLPPEIEKICRSIAAAGEKVYVVGGTVRDMLAGNAVSDWDLATTATPEKVMKLFRRVVPTGLEHGTVTVLEGDEKAEITTLRGEGRYSDGRRPDSVVFLTDIEQDLMRRDFTINAMAWDPSKDELRDPFGGKKDFEDRILRAVGDPSERFAEDGLRLLRAARFAAVLGFDVDEKTLSAMPFHAGALAKISIERKRNELAKMLCAEKPSRGLKIVKETEMLPFISEDLSALAGIEIGNSHKIDAWKHTLDCVDAVLPRLPLRLAALLIGTVMAERASKGAFIANTARNWLSKMRFDKKTVERAVHILSMQGFHHLDMTSDAEIRRFLSRVGRESADDVMALKRASVESLEPTQKALDSFDRFSSRVSAAAASTAALCARELAVNGDELMQHLSIPSGPRVGTLLDSLLDRVLEHPEENRKENLLKYAEKLMAR